MKKVIAALMSFVAIALSEGAIAQYSSPHKYTDAFGKTKIYIPGTADAVVDVITENTKEYDFSVNACGWISLRESSTRKIKSFSVPSRNINFPNFTPTLIHPSIGPVCSFNGGSTNSGWAQWEDSLLNQPNGSLWHIQSTNKYFVKIVSGINASLASVRGVVISDNIIKNKINSCGFGVIIVSATRPMTTFKIASIDYNLANLPSVTKPQICRIQSGLKLRYVPID